MNWGVLLAAFFTSALACLLLARAAPRLGLVDLPDARKRHEAPVPLVGGIAVLCGFALALMLRGEDWGLLREAGGPVLLLFVLGLIDDARNLSARFKLLVQLLAAWWLVAASGAALATMPLPFLAGHLDLGVLALPLTVLMVVAIINAINMIDGLDGLAGGCLAIGVASLGLAAALVGRLHLAALAACLCAAVLGFLVWNARWPWQSRARVFLGDAGALAVGLLLCWMILKLSLLWRGFEVERVPLTVVLAPVAVPVIDLFVVAFWRAAEGRNPLQADRGHSHHLLLEMGLSTVAAVRLIWLAAAAVTGATFLAWRLGVEEGRLLGVLVAASLLYLLWFRYSWLRVRRKAVAVPAPGPGVLFVTTGLGVGGAERALERLLPRLQAHGLRLAVISLREPQPVGQALRAAGVEVFELGMAPSRPSLLGLLRLWRAVRAFRPDLLQGWMYHGDLAAHLARLAAPRAKVVLGIHQTLARLELESPATRVVIRLDAWLSRFAARALYVAQAARSQHEAAGYSAPAVVLPNAVDCTLFRPDAQARADLRAELGLAGQLRLICMPGRLHPAKNHAGFLRAAARVARLRPDLAFVLAGSGVECSDPVLAPLLAEPALQGRVFALGPREDVPRLLAGSDLHVLSSIQEALPTVVMEAMSCGVPSIVTDVGDAALMVAETGWLIAPGDDEALAGAMLAALDEPQERHAERSRAARARAEALYSLEAVAQRYVDLYRSLA